MHLYGHEWQSQKGRPFDNFAMRVVLKLAEALEISMGEKGSTIESRGLFRSRISGKIGLTGALVTAGEEEEVPARIEAKDGLGAGGSPGADGGAAKAAMPGEQAKP